MNEYFGQLTCKNSCRAIRVIFRFLVALDKIHIWWKITINLSTSVINNNNFVNPSVWLRYMPNVFNDNIL